MVRNLLNSLYMLVLFVVFVVFVSGCDRQSIVPIEPERPSNIPLESIWVGGMDGGVFVIVKESKKRIRNSLYYAEIYYVSGDLAYQGAMQISPLGAVFNMEKKESYEGWDGDTLYLSNNQRLEIKE